MRMINIAIHKIHFIGNPNPSYVTGTRELVATLKDFERLW